MASIDNDYQFDDDDDDWLGRKQRGLLEVNRSMLQGEPDRGKDLKMNKKTKRQKYKIQNIDCKKCQKSTVPKKVIFGFFGIGCRNGEKSNFQFQFKISVLMFF